MMLCYCAKLKAIRYESTGLSRIVADKSHSVIVAKHVICEINDEFITDEWAWLTVYVPTQVGTLTQVVTSVHLGRPT